MTKEGYFFLSYESFEYFFEGAWKSLQGRGKSTFPCSFNSKGSQDKKKQPSLVKLYSISKIAFYPHFPLQSQCIPAHLWLLEYLASLDIQTEAIRGRKTLTFWGKSGGKMQFGLSLITFLKKIAISLKSWQSE